MILCESKQACNYTPEHVTQIPNSDFLHEILRSDFSERGAEVSGMRAGANVRG